MVTRSQTKQAREALADSQHSQMPPDTVQNYLKFQSREQFAKDIFGHRGKMDIFNTHKFVEYQKDDNFINMARKMVVLKPNSWKDQDLKALTKHRPYLASKLRLEQLFINKTTNELQCKCTS